MSTDSSIISSEVRSKVDILFKKEKDPESLRELVKKCPGHYFAWYCLWNYVKEFHNLLLSELMFVRELIEAEPKCYQGWNYRTQIFGSLSHEHLKLGMLVSELANMDIILSRDTKNHHAWNYRQWLVSKFHDISEIYEQEIRSLSLLMDEDADNSSIYQYRLWLIKDLKNVDYKAEIDYIAQSIHTRQFILSESLINYINAYIKLWYEKSSNTVSEITVNNVSLNCI